MTAPHPEDAMLQALAGAAGHGTYEAHVTVAAGGTADRDRFRAACADLGVKAVLIELPDGEARSQPMTASFHRGDLADVAAEVAGVARRLRAAGFPVRRVKLEAVATNAGVPEADAEAAAAPPDRYFEFHVKLALPAGADLDRLRAVCDRFGARLSRNAFKTEADGRSERFATLRAYRVGRAAAFHRLDDLAEELTAAGYAVVNRQKEYSLFDSNARLDAGWIDGPADEAGGR